MKKRNVWVFSLFIGLSVLVGACAPALSAKSEDMAAGEAPMDWFNEAEAPVMEEALDADRSYTSGTGPSTSAVERMVIYNANLEIAVEDPTSAMETVIQMAEDAGGFVVSSNIYQYNYDSGGSHPKAHITVRVPAGQLDSIMTAIKALTPIPEEDVLSENVSGQDVTAEYTDLESRLRNLEAAEEALVELMEEAQDPEDVLNIFDELTYYRGEIEVVKGRMKYLEESAALSAITVEIVAKESIQPIEIAGWEPKGTMKKAVEALIKAGQFLADGAIWFGIFCLPFLIPLGIGVYFLVQLIRKRKAKKLARKAEVIQDLEEG